MVHCGVLQGCAETDVGVTWLGLTTLITYGICGMMWYHYLIACAAACFVLGLMVGLVRFICCRRPLVNHITYVVHQDAPYHQLPEKKQQYR